MNFSMRGTSFTVLFIFSVSCLFAKLASGQTTGQCACPTCNGATTVGEDVRLTVSLYRAAVASERVYSSRQTYRGRERLSWRPTSSYSALSRIFIH